ncbi:hypothetical protein DFH09DRAFT_1086884 [Mycena vulgaris]|nr:hypothetical protein DFH09DRAFT_1086884 [Mycena vulgaris]
MGIGFSRGSGRGSTAGITLINEFSRSFQDDPVAELYTEYSPPLRLKICRPTVVRSLNAATSFDVDPFVFIVQKARGMRSWDARVTNMFHPGHVGLGVNRGRYVTKAVRIPPEPSPCPGTPAGDFPALQAGEENKVNGGAEKKTSATRAEGIAGEGTPVVGCEGPVRGASGLELPGAHFAGGAAGARSSNEGAARARAREGETELGRRWIKLRDDAIMK